MRYRRIDLNLVAALDVLLAERSVSRAAEALNLSQSAVSGILARLREYFDDPLLVPVGRHLQLTPLAQSLCGPAREAMAGIDRLIETRPSFDPASADRTVRIAASDYVVTAYLADALERIAALAPRLRFQLQPTLQIGPQGNVMLDAMDHDFVVLPAHLCDPEHPQAPLFDDSYTVIAWREHRSLGDTLGFDEYCALGHVIFQNPHAGTGLPWFDQWYLNQHGATRRIEVTAASFNLLAPLVVGTQRIATVQTRLAQRVAQSLPLRCLPLPIEAPRLTEVLQWHRHRADDPALAWLRDQLLQR
jgi:DNA-binding transcriptional LysR family regulator